MENFRSYYKREEFGRKKLGMRVDNIKKTTGWGLVIERLLWLHMIP
jgi:hypothetical protein